MRNEELLPNPKAMPLKLKLILTAVGITVFCGFAYIANNSLSGNSKEAETISRSAKPETAKDLLLTIHDVGRESEPNDIQIVTPDKQNKNTLYREVAKQNDALKAEMESKDEWISRVSSKQEQQIKVVKTSVELQEQAKQQLHNLTTKLDTLSLKLNQLDKSSQKTAYVTTKRRARAIVKMTTKPKIAPRMRLLSVDLWGGEHFAQFELNGVIQLTGLNEQIDGWKVVSIRPTSVIVSDNKGGKVELQAN